MSKTVKLVSSDGEFFEVDQSVAMQSQKINSYFIDNDNRIIPLPNVMGNVLSKVLEYCKKHATARNTELLNADEEMNKWDSEFVDHVGLSQLIDLIRAANYLDVKGLLDLTCQKVADLIIAGKIPEEIRETMNIENYDFTPVEENQIRKEMNSWAFQ